MAICRKGTVNNRMVDVITQEEYMQNQYLYNDYNVAIQNGQYLYPIRKSDTGPGYYRKNDIIGYFINPNEEDSSLYSSENIIDLGNSNSIKEAIEKSEYLNNIERNILCSPDDLTVPVISQKDDPVMQILKQAVIDKEIDVKKYKHRFSDSDNDLRFLKKSEISLKKLKVFGDALDMKITVTIEDKNENVPNPIGKVYTTEITGGSINE